MDAYTLPYGAVTINAGIAAEQWAAAFYMTKDVIAEIRPILEAIINGKQYETLMKYF